MSGVKTEQPFSTLVAVVALAVTMIGPLFIKGTFLAFLLGACGWFGGFALARIGRPL